MFSSVVPDSFWSKVDRSAGGDACWAWTGPSSKGYGRITVDGVTRQAHRIAYQLVNGAIANDLVCDHLCRNKACCNPSHLEAVTSKENTLRGIGPTAKNAIKTHCRHGHALVSGNLKLSRIAIGWRDCLECARTRPRSKKKTLTHPQPSGEQS